MRLDHVLGKSQESKYMEVKNIQQVQMRYVQQYSMIHLVHNLDNETGLLINQFYEKKKKKIAERPLETFPFNKQDPRCIEENTF